MPHSRWRTLPLSRTCARAPYALSLCIYVSICLCVYDDKALLFINTITNKSMYLCVYVSIDIVSIHIYLSSVHLCIFLSVWRAVHVHPHIDHSARHIVLHQTQGAHWGKRQLILTIRTRTARSVFKKAAALGPSANPPWVSSRRIGF